MQTYKTQLQRQLEEQGWEVVEVIVCDEWWADEFWKIQSRRNLWGHEIVLTFLVDPQWDSGRKKAGVWCIAATERLPPDRVVAETGIGQCRITGKVRFGEELAAFVAALDIYRNDLETRTQEIS